MKILLANPRGFCAGVERAIGIVERGLEIFGKPLYVKHEVVHNRVVVEDLKSRGAVFIEDLNEVPIGSHLIFSAHGVSPAIRAEADSRQLKIFDATCPLVTKVHMEVARFSKKGHECIMIGHQGHPEVEGTLGCYSNKDGAIYLVENEQDAEAIQIKDPKNLYCVTQTTLSVDETKAILDILQTRFPMMQRPKKDDICYATQNRQDAVKEMVPLCDLILVVGSETSSNSNRLRELAEHLGVRSYLLDSVDVIKSSWFDGVDVVGVTAGASAPEHLVQSVISKIKDINNKNNNCEYSDIQIEELSGKLEDIEFSMPKALRDIPIKVIQ